MAGFDKVVRAGLMEVEFRGQSLIFPIQQFIMELSAMKALHWLSEGTVPHVSRPINYILAGFPVRDATMGPSTLVPSSVADDGGFKHFQFRGNIKPFIMLSAEGQCWHLIALLTPKHWISSSQDVKRGLNGHRVA